MEQGSIDSGTRLSSPNRMVWNYFGALRRAVHRVLSDKNEDSKKQEVAVCIFLAVTVVETFLNVYFRVVVDEEPYIRHKDRFLEDLKSRIPLRRKLDEWPKNILGRTLSQTEGAGKAFAELRMHRNNLMHFTSSHQTLNLSGVTIHGMVDTTVYDTLDDEQAISALRVAEEIVSELFVLRGIPKEQVSHSLHAWTGKPPI